MILTITLNPAIDSSYQIDSLEVDTVMRCDNYDKTAGGKGLNVSRILKKLDMEINATGFVGGKNGEYFLELLEKDGVESEFVSIGGNTRICIAIIGKDGTQTEILETGPTINRNEEEIFLERYLKLVKNVDLVCASGSLPKGLAKDFYEKLARLSNESGTPFLLDSSGESLKNGIKGKPYLIKPNIDELRDFAGQDIESESEIVSVARNIIATGVKYVVISMGKDGAILVTEKRVYRGSAPNIEAVNPVGSGDSMMGGFCKAIHDEMSECEILKLGIACGTANAMERETGRIDILKVNKLMEEIEVNEIFI
jgi:tagatose 6-phosphate kinase